mgnify:CR=1 FL=1
MKYRDKLLIVSVAFGSALVAFFLANFIFGGEKSYTLKAPTVEKITSEFTAPNTKYFNNTAINPTQEINIGDQSNSKPFNR